MTFEVSSKWFVTYTYDGPVGDEGCKCFEYGIDASKFKERIEKAGYRCHVFFGELSGMFHPKNGKHGDGCTCKRCEQ